LIAVGVPAEQIYVARLCTKCRDEFHSYRRERQHVGRMFSWIGVKSTGTAGEPAAESRSSRP
jgi:copper oxidase (laccase) domain-containing protein